MEKEQKKSKKSSAPPKAAIGRPRKPVNYDADSLLLKAGEYFSKCDSRTRIVMTRDGAERIPYPAPYCIEGLCCFLRISRNDFAAWRKRDDDLGRCADYIHMKITENRVTGALDGTQNSSFAQFLLKNNAPEEYREKVELETGVSSQIADIFERSLNQWSVKER